MSIALLTQKYEVQLYGVLHCYDRLVFSGNLHPFCYAQSMTKFLYEQKRLSAVCRTPARRDSGECRTVNRGEPDRDWFIRKQETCRKEERVQTIL